MQNKDQYKGEILMKHRQLYATLSVILSLLLVLSACGGGGGEGAADKKPVSEEEKSKFPVKVDTDEEAVENGTLTKALVSDTPFEGTLSTVFYQGQPDWEIIEWFEEGLLDLDENYNIDNTGAATYELSDDKRTVTIKIKDGVNWHDGEPVKAEDLEFTYLTIGHPKYTGVRYDSTMSGIEGMEDYHTGKADNISGVKVIDDKTISITYKTADPTILSGLQTTPMPKHYLADVPVDKMAASPKIREKPIGFGPFKVEKVTPGESVTLVRNDDYWRGKPQLKSIVIKVVNPDVIVNSMKNGDVDIASFPTALYPDAVKNKNYTILGIKDLAYSYIGFKLGHWDAEKGEAVMDKPKMQNVKLRQAMGYALDIEKVAEEQYSGLYYKANSLIPESFPEWNNKDMKGFTYDPDKAKQLLDEAGYKDVNDDGLREDPDGKKFTISFASMSGTKVAEPIAKFFMQNWKDVGLDVQLYQGRLQEFNSFYKNIQEDVEDIDVYAAAWGTGSDVNPAGLYGKTAQFNLPRYVSEKNEELLKKGVSPEAFDTDYRKQVYNDWQELMFEEAPVIPTFFRYAIVGVNKRVKYYSVDPTVEDKYKVSVSSETPVKGE